MLRLKFYSIALGFLMICSLSGECINPGDRFDIIDLFKDMNLEQAIAITLRNQREIQISQMEVEEQRGVLQQSAGPFDPFLNLIGDYNSKLDRQYFPGGIRTNWSAHETTSSGELRKLTRIGTQFSLVANVDQNYDRLDFFTGATPAIKSNQGTILFLIEQPLLNGFMWGNDVTIERANRKTLEATIYENLFIVSQSVNRTVNSYWEVIAAKELLKVQEENLEHFKELQQSTQTLIDGLQLARAEILQPEAQVDQAEVDVILAKQRVFSAMQALLFDLGFSDEGDELTLEDALAAEFPPIPEDFPILFSQVHDFLSYAPIARPDIIASYLRQDAAAILVQGGYNAILPQLDVVGGVTKQDFYTKGKAKSLFRPLNMKKPETDYRIGIRFSYPICNNGARGQLYARKATLQRLNLISQQLIQSTSQQIMDQWSDVIATSRALSKNAQVIEKNAELVEYETIKLKAGYSTLFVLIDFQNRLARALSERAELKKRFMQGVANLRFLTGTMIIPTRFLECYQVGDVTQLPNLTDGTVEELKKYTKSDSERE